MSLEEFFKWYNIIFYVSIALGVSFIGASAMGIGADTDFDIDVDSDGINADHGVLSRALSVFGIGRCPASIVIFTALLIFGGSGIILNMLFAPYLAIVSVIGAFFAMTSLTRVIAITISKFMPNTETYKITNESFIGRTGKVILKTDDTFGKVHVRDQYGSLHKLNAKAFPGITYEIGTEVLVIEHKDSSYYVANPQEFK